MHPMSLSGWSANATSLALIVALASAPARAQNIDEGKSGAKLFAESCANCHNSARGLAKDRLSVTLGYYLGQHYTTNSASAQALAAYLQSVDAARSKPQPAAGNRARSRRRRRRHGRPPRSQGGDAISWTTNVQHSIRYDNR